MSRYDARLYLQRVGERPTSYTQDDACVPLPPTTGTEAPKIPEGPFGPPPTFTHIPEDRRHLPQPSYGFRSIPVASEPSLSRTQCQVGYAQGSLSNLPPSLPRPMPPLVNGTVPRAISAYPSVSNYIKASTTFNSEIRAPSLPNLPTSQPTCHIGGGFGTSNAPVRINLLV
ncbi:hypothetical protein GMRT_10835 [Giardia muris]|uniref:Uncharacterized protein n=1 Tax=Giardia muris TaxID=5742 RepID=A0A4Z1SNZ6_GIAMU|nr:hypothetical protein GMRT_10835 [Giardia muris]|eukprot:TNJ27532.1 hypothetical protein GMRT_10835 [Giardia muris]